MTWPRGALLPRLPFSPNGRRRVNSGTAPPLSGDQAFPWGTNPYSSRQRRRFPPQVPPACPRALSCRAKRVSASGPTISGPAATISSRAATFGEGSFRAALAVSAFRLAFPKFVFCGATISDHFLNSLDCLQWRGGDHLFRTATIGDNFQNCLDCLQVWAATIFPRLEVI